MTGRKQNVRLAAAYRKLPSEGRDALDRAIRKLANIHRDFTRQGYSEKKGKRNAHSGC
jgi:hypothetical protein